MKHDPASHHRRSIRLKEYDYTQAGAYFVTICTQEWVEVLNDPVVVGIITDVWCALPLWFPTIARDEFVIMPTHVHLIVWLHPPDSVGATLAVAPLAVAPNGAGASPAPTEWVVPRPTTANVKPALGDVIGTFKSLVFTVYLGWIKTHDPARQARFWQRNYYEHIIRNEAELDAIRRYIRDNPLRWALDRDNPRNLRHLPPPSRTADYLEDVQGLLQEGGL
jgi:REP element-mobilizing transposase RayT